MATIRKRGASWQVQVRRQGLPPLTRTFRARTAANLWARQQETDIDRGDLPQGPRTLRTHMLRSLLERYRETVTPQKRGASQEAYKLKVILKHPIADLPLDRLTPSQIARYRDDRLARVAGDTVQRELAVLQHCLQLARDEWGIALPRNPVQAIKLPSCGRARERRVTAEELRSLIAVAEKGRCRYLAPMIHVAVATGIRRGELLHIRWIDLNPATRTVRLQWTKNGRARLVPLSSQALAALSSMPRVDERIFPVTPNAFRLAWERLKRRASVSGLRFHDLRHEAISRLFEKGLSVPEVAMISGHRDLRMLFRYTHPKPDLVAAKLG